MKRYSVLLIALALVLITASASFAVFPKPDGSATFKMQQGWAGAGLPVWYICTDTSDVNFASSQHLTLAPKLANGFYGAGVAAMFIVKNPIESQGPVFETIPGQNLYSGIWRVRLVTWLNLSARVPLTSIGQILNLKNQGKLKYDETEVRIDYPIVAVGSLGCPGNTSPTRFTIAQALSFNTLTKTVTLPTFKVYCQNPSTQAITVGKVIIPDVGNPTLARLIGANIAPALNFYPAGGKSIIDLFNWQQPYLTSVLPIPPTQYLVRSACPTSLSVSNFNYNYSPVATFDIFNRNTLPLGTVINNFKLFEKYRSSNLVTLAASLNVNAPAVY